MAEFRRDQQPGQHGFPQANMFHQPDLEELLLGRVERHPLIEFRRGAEVTGLDSTAGYLPAGVCQQHQREEPGHLAIPGQLRMHHPGQPDRLTRQVGAVQLAARGGGVALVEDQVEHVQDDPQPLLALGAVRQAERAARGLDALLGPADPGRHRGLWHQECTGDLGRGLIP